MAEKEKFDRSLEHVNIGTIGQPKLTAFACERICLVT